jgi:hypothetical protein
MSQDEFDLFSTDLGRAVFTGRTLAYHNVSVISSKSLFCFWLTGEFCNSYKLHTIWDFNWWELIPEGGFQATMYTYDTWRCR